MDTKTDKRLNIRLKIDDYSKIEAAAAERGISVSAFLRQAGLMLAAQTIETTTEKFPALTPPE
jgi:uncharacterized protein (DUF1778 family)